MKHKQSLEQRIKRGQILTTAFLFLLIVSVLAFIVFGLRWFNLIKLPEFVENILYFGGSDGEKTPEDDNYIYKLLPKPSDNSPESDGSVIVTAEITGENLTSLLSALEIPERVYAKTETVHYTDGASRKIEAVLQKKDKEFHYETRENGSEAECFIIDAENGREHYRNYITETEISYQREFDWRSVPNVYLIGEYFNLALTDGVITELRVERGKEENILAFTLANETLNQREEYKISLDCGMVKSIASYFGNKKYYEYKAVEILSSDDPDDINLPAFEDCKVFGDSE